MECNARRVKHIIVWSVGAEWGSRVGSVECGVEWGISSVQC